ncbi:MAG: glycyl-radical enzyme activating protein [Lachnospiraceae bacterium]|nr:glycyl-radical enzyme activating protein [Lachnospiraceae bacterium]
MAIKGTIFNIQHFSINDGPGIRTVVFCKGCPLRCRWCANPESQSFSPELSWIGKECIGCRACVESLPELSCRFEGERLCFDREKVVSLEKVDGVCPTGALSLIGRRVTVDEVLSEVEADQKFYERSEGGLTVSGGEPMAQPEFTLALLSEAKNRSIHRTMETCGMGASGVMEEAAKYLDVLYFDVKLHDPQKHKEWTGAGNERILDNLFLARRVRPDLTIRVRTPVIPGVNDNEEELREIHRIALDLGAEHELLKYHRLGASKYEGLGRDYPMGEVKLSEERFQELKSSIFVTGVL